MPCGFDGVSDDREVVFVDLVLPRKLGRWSFRFDGVPNSALLKALAANTGAGVSGWSICVVSV